MKSKCSRVVENVVNAFINHKVHKSIGPLYLLKKDDAAVEISKEVSNP
jgi:hypothetical protein